MKTLDQSILKEPLAEARRFAALSGPFDPAEAPLGDPERPEAATVASLLSESCDTNPPGVDWRWLMRPAERANVLGSLGEAELQSAVHQRLADADPETEDMLLAILGQAPFDRASLEQELDRAKSRQRLDRIVLALDRAGGAAKCSDLLIPARSAIARINARERAETIARRPFVGRQAEVAAIVDWVTHAYYDPPVQCLLVTGPPGIGKSTVLGQALIAVTRTRNAIVLRIDFDRAGLDVRDKLGLTMEAARQIGEQLGRDGVDLLNVRLDAAAAAAPGSPDEYSLSESASAPGISPEQLLASIGDAVGRGGRPVLVVLDTLEVLRGRGETAPQLLFHWLDELVLHGMRPVSVIAAGRGNALDSCRDRYDRALELPCLSHAESLEFLVRLDVPEAYRIDLAAIGEGSPLRLRLAEEVFRRIGADELKRLKRRRRIDEGFLYRFLLSRIDDQDLKRLAHPGLIVRRINAALLRDVLVPALRLKPVSDERAAELLGELSAHHWLVEPDPDPFAVGFLKHRSDMRALLLPVLYRTAPGKAARINRAAAAWFAARGQPWSEVEAAYHRLQLMRVEREAPAIAWSALARIDDMMLDELPENARDHVLAAVGRRGSVQRAGAAAGPPDETGIHRELMGILERADWAEGAYLIDSFDQERRLDPASVAADAVRAVLWRSGRWSAARRWLRDRDLARADDSDLGALEPALALARLEMLAEFQPARALRWFEEQDTPQFELSRAALVAKDNVARHGALGLMLARLPDVWPQQALRDTESNLVGAILAMGTGNDKDPDFQRVRRVAWERLQRHFVQAPAADQINPARLLAALTPYTRLAANLSADPVRASWMGEHARLLFEPQAERLAARFGTRTQRQAGAVFTQVIDNVADLGLFAEWAGVAAFVRPDRDLALVARSAERWRRTVAGNWSYPARPPSWPRPAIDSTSLDRLRRLRGAQQPLEAAYSELGTWSLPEDFPPPFDPGAPGVLAAIRRRFKRLIGSAAARSKDGDEAVLEWLLQGRMPSAFAPAMAVIIQEERKKGAKRHE